jgi:hypothetical protein
MHTDVKEEKAVLIRESMIRPTGMIVTYEQNTSVADT